MRGDVTIIGGGWSVRNVGLEKLAGLIIAVNDAAILAPRWDFAVSMDRLWAEHRIDQLERIVLAAAAIGAPPRKVWIRTNALQNLPSTRGLSWLQRFECDHTSSRFSSDPDTLNGTNSGACALNLAWQLNPTRVFLLGFDMNMDPAGGSLKPNAGAAYWYPPYTWTDGRVTTSPGKYSRWSTQFGEARKAFEKIGATVYNVSPTSAIEAFLKITPDQYHRACER